MDNSLFHGNMVTTQRILYTPSAFAKNTLLHLQETGTLTAQSPHTSARDGLDSYLFFFVVSGAGILKYNGRKYSLTAGDCVFLDCRGHYSHSTSHDLWQLKWAHFYGPYMPGIYEKYTERGGRPCFHAEFPEAYRTLLDDLYVIADSEDYVKDMRINEKLNALLTLLMKESWNPEHDQRPTAKKQNLIAIKEYLNAHYMEKISLDQLAEEFYVNKFYLTRIFKEQFGVSLGNYLLQVRITHAKQMLRFSESSLDNISAACGMGDAAYFSRMFKKVEGITPGEYRRRW